MWLGRTGRQWKGSKVTEGLAPCCRTVERSWPRKMPLRPTAVTQPLLSRCALIGRRARAPNRRLLVLGLPRDRGPIPRAHLRPLPIIPLAPLLPRLIILVGFDRYVDRLAVLGELLVQAVQEEDEELVRVLLLAHEPARNEIR